jgi:hypothetical protein
MQAPLPDSFPVRSRVVTRPIPGSRGNNKCAVLASQILSPKYNAEQKQYPEEILPITANADAIRDQVLRSHRARFPFCEWPRISVYM